MHIRHLEPTDYPPIISVLNSWWGGRNMADMLPRLFFVHFRQTSFIAESGENILGFLVGFVSQTRPDEAYIHFVGVNPEYRGRGLGRTLYERFFIAAADLGCRTVSCVTAPINKTSIAFHQAMGFVTKPGEKTVDGIPVAENYDGQGGDRVLFIKMLAPS